MTNSARPFAEMLPPMNPADDAVHEHELTYFDGSSRKVHISQREIPYPKGRLIISRTDLNSIITHANDAFVELSGYTREELIGQPQCILRHPDMPRAIYQSLWGTLAGDGRPKWHGYIKNLNKDGSHYWVYATAVQNKRDGKVVGYTSVRREMSRSKIDEMTAKYKEMIAAEGGG